MTLTTSTHLNFRGDARAALELYRSVFGGEVTITTYGDLGMPQDAPDAASVVFGQVATRDGLRLLAYDIPGETGGSVGHAGSTRRENGVTLTDRPFFVAVDGQDLAEVQQVWDRLSAGATVVEPLAASAWSPGFGMLTDRFGVTWALGVTPAPAA